MTKFHHYNQLYTNSDRLQYSIIMALIISLIYLCFSFISSNEILFEFFVSGLIFVVLTYFSFFFKIPEKIRNISWKIEEWGNKR